MTRSRLLHLVTAAALLVAAPATAAVTTRSASPDDTPRVAWLDRYQESRQGPEQTERFSKSFKVGADGVLDLQNVAGDVRVVTGRGSDIQIEAIKRVRSRNGDDARQLLNELRIEATQVGNRVEVRTIYPRSRYRNVSASVDYTITVPAPVAVTAKSISGDVSVNGVRGEVRAESISGNVELTGTPNLALAKTVSGNVTAKEIGAQTMLTLGSVSGNVIASALKVRSLEAGTISGDVQLSNLQAERVQAKSVSGNIAFEAGLAKGGRYEFSSHSGNVRLILAGASGFELDASTFSGSIRSDFPVTLRSTTDAADRGRRGPGNRAIRGTYGDAGAILVVRSFSGNAVIVKK